MLSATLQGDISQCWLTSKCLHRSGGTECLIHAKHGLHLQALISFVGDCQDTDSLQDVLELLCKLLQRNETTQRPMLAILERLGGVELFTSLVQREQQTLKVLGLRILAAFIPLTNQQPQTLGSAGQWTHNCFHSIWRLAGHWLAWSSFIPSISCNSYLTLQLSLMSASEWAMCEEQMQPTVLRRRVAVCLASIYLAIAI